MATLTDNKKNTKSDNRKFVAFTEKAKLILENEKKALNVNTESAAFEKLYAELIQLRAENAAQKARKEVQKTDRFSEIRKAFENLKAQNAEIWNEKHAHKQVPNTSFFSNKAKNGVGVFSRGLIADYIETKEVLEYIQLLQTSFEAWQLTSNFKRHS